MPEDNLIPQRLKDMPGSEWYKPPAKKFIPREKPTEIVEPERAEVKIPDFLPPDILSQLGNQWYEGTTGKPQSFEEQQFVLDYLGKYGMKPTTGELPTFDKATYDPTSTMGKLGFRTRADYDVAESMGEQYGPLAGADVPFNTGIVVTDWEGNPIGRYMDVNRPEAQKAIAEGRYINPVSGPLAEKYAGGLPGSEQYYNKPMAPFQRPGMEEALGRYSPEQVYQARLDDYIEQKTVEDEPKFDQWVEEFNNRGYALEEYRETGKMPEDSYNRMMQAHMEEYAAKFGELYLSPENAKIANKILGIEDKVTGLRTKAQELMGQGTPADQLTELLFGVRSDIGSVQGANIMRLYNEMLYGWPVKDRYGNVTLTGGMQQEYETAKAKQPEPWSGYPPKEKGQPQDIVDIINGINTTPEYRRYLLSNINYLRQLWEQSGEPDFYTWLLSYQGVR